MNNLEIIIFIVYWIGTLFNVFTNKYIIFPTKKFSNSTATIIIKETIRLLFIIFSWFSWIIYGIVIITEKYDTRR